MAGDCYKLRFSPKVIVCSGSLMVFAIAMPVTLGLYYSGRALLGICLGSTIVIIGSFFITLFLGTFGKRNVSSTGTGDRETENVEMQTINIDIPSQSVVYIPNLPPYTPTSDPDSKKYSPPSYTEAVGASLP